MKKESSIKKGPAVYGRALFVLLILSFVAMSNNAAAKTLIVTHPETGFDRISSGGQATRSLLAEAGFRQKIVLVTKGGQNRFTFDSKGLDFELRRSNSGEIRWSDVDDEVVLGGGHYTACFFVTIQSIVQFAKNNMKIQIQMPAIYNDPVAVGYFSGLTQTLDGLDEKAPITMSQYFENLNDQDLLTAISSFGKHLYDGIPTPTPLHSGRSNLDISVVLSLEGTVIAKIGNGKQGIAIDFKR